MTHVSVIGLAEDAFAVCVYDGTMSIVSFARDARVQHPEVSDWFVVTSDRVDHAMSVVPGLILRDARLTSRRFYLRETFFARIFKQVGVCMVSEPVLKGVHDSPSLLRVMDTAQQSKTALLLIAPRFSGEVIATFAVNHEQSALSSLPLRADERSIPELARALGVPVCGAESLQMTSSLPIREVIATPDAALVVSEPGSAGTKSVGVINVGGVSAADALRHREELRETLGW